MNYEFIYLEKTLFKQFFINLFLFSFLNALIFQIIGDWGLGIGDWGLGIGDWAQSPIPNPQSPLMHLKKKIKINL